MKKPEGLSWDVGGSLYTTPMAGLGAIKAVEPLRSYLDSSAAHGITALDAIRDAIAGKPWLPPLPALALRQLTEPRE